jgi:hypothetical protein
VQFFHCLHCETVWQHAGASKSLHREQLDASLPGDLKQQYQQLSDWVGRMVTAYDGRLRFKIIDAVSIEGWIKSLYYRVREYPAVIVDGEKKSIGADFTRATALIEQRLASPSH